MSALEQLVGNMTVAQLAEAAGLTIDEVVSLVLKQSASRPVAPRGRKPGSDEPTTTTQSKAAAGSFAITERQHETRTQAGRDALDRAIVTLLKQTGERMRAADIRDAVGGSASQVRARLNALIGDARVAYTGKASGTVYWVK
jgi:hypothetical protein